MLGLDHILRCRVCGRPTAECQSADTQEDWVAGDPVRCHAATAVMVKQSAYSEETNPQLSALSWPVHRLRREEQS